MKRLWSRRREREALLSSYKKRGSLNLLETYERKIREQDPKIKLLRLLKDRSLWDGLLSTAVSFNSVFLHLYLLYQPLAGRLSQINLFLQILMTSRGDNNRKDFPVVLQPPVLHIQKCHQLCLIFTSG